VSANIQGSVADGFARQGGFRLLPGLDSTVPVISQNAAQSDIGAADQEMAVAEQDRLFTRQGGMPSRQQTQSNPGLLNA